MKVGMVHLTMNLPSLFLRYFRHTIGWGVNFNISQVGALAMEFMSVIVYNYHIVISIIQFEIYCLNVSLFCRKKSCLDMWHYSFLQTHLEA